MILLLLICLVAVEVLQLCVMHRMLSLMQTEKPNTAPPPPPKARSSFVVKRMEQKLKEAMYPSGE